ncbi:MAG: MotA/TolQ/ExbB proton channel family protein [Bacteroidetes bacterium]|nr:MotA/TolQ/ExbB proton channel family protein [Bacteroidota bacterium]
MQENLNDPSTDSLMELILSGGLASTIIMIVLFVFLLITLYITIERYLVYRSVLSTLQSDTAQNELVEQMRSIASNSFIKSNSSAKAEKAIENWASSLVFELERNTATLATLSGAAPMLGFLGTVIGMILAFREMAVSQGQAEIASLAGGIYTAMITTVGGLVVGIISYIAYNQLAAMLTQITKRLEKEGNQLIDHLEN